MVGLKQRQYAKRYSHFVPSITPAAARTTGEFHPGRNMMQHIMAQGYYPGQVVNLCLEYLCLLGLGTEGDRLASVIMGLTLMSRMLGFTLGQAEYGLSQQSTAARRQFADTCLQHVWSHLGKDLQRAAGVAETELEGDGSQPAAAEAAAGASSSGGSCVSSRSREVGGMTIRREGVEVQLPADAVARVRLVWDEYGTGLFCAIRLYSECFGQLPFEHYMRQPMRASRVVEAAFRAADQECIRNTSDMVQLLINVFWAAETTSPEGSAPTSDLLANRRLAAQSCSEIVSVLKVISQPLKPSVNQQDISEWQVRVASYATMAGPTVLSWALG